MPYQRDDWRELPVHPAAEKFPMMPEERLLEIAADMEANGYDTRKPIDLKDGVILDGRNRRAACELAGVAPWFEDYENDDPVELIMRGNLARREMSESERAIVVVGLYPEYQAEATERQRTAGGDRKSETAKSLHVARREAISEPSKPAPQASAVLARKAGIGQSTLDRALRIQREDLALYARVEAGELKVNTAWRMLPSTRKETKAAVKTAKLPKGTVNKYPRRGPELPLEDWEARIEGKIEPFLDVAYALWQIREQSLFKGDYSQFHHYLQSRWGIVFRLGEMTTCGIDSLELSGQKRGEDR